MFGIIVSGHGHFASGITSALELIMGKQEKYQSVDFPISDTITELSENLENALKMFGDEENILICCDLLSGSPFNVSIMEAMKDERIRVIYGTNLGMLMEIVMKRSIGNSFADIVKEAINTGKSQIGLFDASAVDDDDDFQ